MKKASKSLAKNFLVIVLIFICISAIFALFTPLSPPLTEISISQLAQEINQDKVKKITVTGNDILIDYRDESQAKSRKGAEIDISDTLINYGVDKGKLAQLDSAVEQEKTGWAQMSSILLIMLPLLLFGWLFWTFTRQAKTGAMQAFNFSKAKARLFGAEGHPKEKISFKDVAGLKEAKEELKEIIEFLKTPKKFLNMGARIPRGVLLLGPPGCGKCITGDSFIITNKGLIQIKDIPKYFSVDNKGKIHDCKIFNVNLKNLDEIEQMPSLWFDLGIQKTIKISSHFGIEIEGTHEHPIVILNKKTGNFEFRRLDELKKGDVLVVNYNHQVFGNYRGLPDKETAYLLGLLTGDGGLSIKDKIYFTNQNKGLVKFVKNYFNDRFGVKLNKASSRIYDWYVSNYRVKEKLRDYGLTDSCARGKRIPESILLGPKEFQVAFLKGLFDTDGSISRKASRIQLSSSSEKIIKQSHVLLLNLGIINKVYSRRKNYNKKLQYYLDMSGDFIVNFAKEIGFGIKEKQAILEKVLNKKRNTNVNIVPFQRKRISFLWNYFKLQVGELNRRFYHDLKIKNIYRYLNGDRNPSKEAMNNLLKLLKQKAPSIKTLPEYKYLQKLAGNQFFFSPIVEIAKNRKARVYDFTVPSGHSFVANGLINHNTLLARAVAGESNVPFFSIAGSEFIELFVGVGSGRVRSLFQEAKKHKKSIIFIDELDAIGRTRGVGIGGGHDEREQTLNQILVEMDGFERDSKTIIIAATNRGDILDPALLRPGRFDRRIVLDLPSIEDREAILKIHARGKPLESKTNLREVAERTPGFSGADLANLINEAAILAARRNKQKVSQKELLESIEKVLLGPERKSHLLSKKEKKIAAYHEAGHALVASFCDHGEPVRKVSIVARGMAAGYTLKSPSEEKSMKTKSEFLGDIATFLGGYCAEEIKFGEVTTGAGNDLKQASWLARKLVKEFGMSKALGPVVFGEKQELMFLGKELSEERNYSEKIAEKIDQEVDKIIKSAKKQAVKILKRKKRFLEKLAKKLIEKETIEKEELIKLLGRSRKKRRE